MRLNQLNATMPLPKPKRFSTRQEAERFIADNDLGGKKKAQRRGGKWELVANPEGMINRSLFTEMLKADYRKRAKAEGWRPAELACTLADANKRAAKLWREMKGKRK